MRSLRGMPTYKTMLKRLSIPKMTQARGDPFAIWAPHPRNEPGGLAKSGGSYLRYLSFLLFNPSPMVAHFSGTCFRLCQCESSALAKFRRFAPPKFQCQEVANTKATPNVGQMARLLHGGC